MALAVRAAGCRGLRKVWTSGACEAAQAGGAGRRASGAMLARRAAGTAGGLLALGAGGWWVALLGTRGSLSASEMFTFDIGVLLEYNNLRTAGYNADASHWFNF